MASIYHFFAHLITNKNQFLQSTPLEKFPFDESLIAARSGGSFPDIILRLETSNRGFIGGEFIELKDSQSYSIASFNSTIPTGQKDITPFLEKKSGKIYGQLKKLGEHIHQEAIRDVFYLIRGKDKKSGSIKVCLIHGSFFETIKVEELIQKAFEQVLEERLREANYAIPDKMKDELVNIFTNQEAFSQNRDINKASVTLRFRIMTEAKTVGNPLKAEIYPTILDNTLNFILPCHTDVEEHRHIALLQLATPQHDFDRLKQFRIKHPLNGEFTVFQIGL